MSVKIGCVGKYIVIHKSKKNDEYYVDYDLWRSKQINRERVSKLGIEKIKQLFCEVIPCEYRHIIGCEYPASYYDENDNLLMSIGDINGSLHTIKSYVQAKHIAESLDSILVNNLTVQILNPKRKKS
jgi:hypothetical protein